MILLINWIFFLLAVWLFVLAVMAVFAANWPHALGWAILCWLFFRVFQLIPSK